MERTIKFYDKEFEKEVSHTFRIEEECFWVEFSDGNQTYDIHYHEDGDKDLICVYRVINGVTDTSNVIYSEKIFEEC